MKITISGEAGGYAPQLAEVLQPACAQSENWPCPSHGAERGFPSPGRGVRPASAVKRRPRCSGQRAICSSGRPREQEEASVHEEPAFDHLTYMADCSRNAVPTLSFLRTLIRSLALMGYDRLMLYTEDTYEVPGYPFFGYLRGRYSQDDLRALDAYAQGYGVELVPCIQTLAHLNGIFHWPAFDACARHGGYPLLRPRGNVCAHRGNGALLR